MIDSMSATQVIAIPSTIDEDTELIDVVPSTGLLNLDMSELKFMNSSGVRTWIRWARPLSSFQQIRLIQVPMMFLSLAGIIADLMISNMFIESVNLVYMNDETEEAKNILFSRANDKATITVPQRILFGEEIFEFDGLIPKTFARNEANFTFVPSITSDELATISAKVTRSIV